MKQPPMYTVKIYWYALSSSVVTSVPIGTGHGSSKRVAAMRAIEEFFAKASDTNKPITIEVLKNR